MTPVICEAHSPQEIDIMIGRRKPLPKHTVKAEGGGYREATEEDTDGVDILGRAHARTCPVRPFPGWFNCRECFIADHVRTLVGGIGA